MSFECAVARISELSREAIPIVEGDYLDEASGLIHCGKCRTPKQVKVHLFGLDRTQNCLCRCATYARDREEEARAERRRAEWLERARKDCFFNPRMAEWNFANDDGENEELTRTAMNYVEHFPEFLENGRGLMLCGSVGTGKSFAACEIANALLERGYKVKVTSFTRLLNRLQSENDKQGVIDELNCYKLLVIDDFGVERATEYAQEQISNAIDSRAASGLPLIITTNMSASAMRQGTTMWEERIYDRLVKMCFPITVDGHSRRRSAAREDYERDKRLLGGDKL